MTVHEDICSEGREAGMAVDDDAWRGRMDTRLGAIDRDVGVPGSDSGTYQDTVAAIEIRLAVLGNEVRWLRWVAVVIVALQLGTTAQLLDISRTLAELAMRS